MKKEIIPGQSVTIEKSLAHSKFNAIFVYMTRRQKQQVGIQKNKLMRYKDILDLYNREKTDDIPAIVIWRKYIYPTYHISRTTLYTILGTPVVKELKQIAHAEAQQISLF